MIECIISRGLDAPTKFAPTLKVGMVAVLRKVYGGFMVPAKVARY